MLIPELIAVFLKELQFIAVDAVAISHGNGVDILDTRFARHFPFYSLALFGKEVDLSLSGFGYHSISGIKKLYQALTVDVVDHDIGVPFGLESKVYIPAGQQYRTLSPDETE